MELRSKNDIELHFEELKKRRNQIKLRDKEYKLSDFDTWKNEILKELKCLKCANYQNLKDIVFRIQFTYDEIIDIINLKFFPSKE